MNTRHYWLKDCWVVTDNRLHQAAPGRGRRAFLYTPSSVKKWQEIVTNAFRQIDEETGFPVLSPNMGYHVGIRAVFPEDVYGYPKSRKLRQKDASNIIKALQDCLFTYLGVDDRYAIQTTASKHVGRVEKIQVLISLTEVPLWDDPPFNLSEFSTRASDVSVTYTLADSIMGKKAPKESAPDSPEKTPSRRKRASKTTQPVSDEELTLKVSRSLRTLSKGRR